VLENSVEPRQRAVVPNTPVSLLKAGHCWLRAREPPELHCAPARLVTREPSSRHRPMRGAQSHRVLVARPRLILDGAWLSFLPAEPRAVRAGSPALELRARARAALPVRSPARQVGVERQERSLRAPPELVERRARHRSCRRCRYARRSACLATHAIQTAILCASSPVRIQRLWRGPAFVLQPSDGYVRESSSPNVRTPESPRTAHRSAARRPPRAFRPRAIQQRIGQSVCTARKVTALRR
jgi:hypothetical protein